MAGDTFVCIGTKYCEKSVVVYICLCVNQLDSNSRCRALGQLLCVDGNVTLWRVYLHVHAFTEKNSVLQVMRDEHLCRIIEAFDIVMCIICYVIY